MAPAGGGQRGANGAAPALPGGSGGGKRQRSSGQAGGIWTRGHNFAWFRSHLGPYGCASPLTYLTSTGPRRAVLPSITPLSHSRGSQQEQGAASARRAAWKSHLRKLPAA
ncbi:hypothetical protein SKAU_G00079710 [Synaphobranchus kaupii]|uniref:Uncharacterized protein n=1 Tax=Synaphobranchus kaupii TaxID=118154 RepID=A0A9Q1FUE9_SYNKA|nr:hypothetical protein SKAU_G00079710 [Synaphobranchus kaupii]